jgi:hypothetical protein
MGFRTAWYKPLSLAMTHRECSPQSCVVEHPADVLESTWFWLAIGPRTKLAMTQQSLVQTTHRTPQRSGLGLTLRAVTVRQTTLGVRQRPCLGAPPFPSTRALALVITAKCYYPMFVTNCELGIIGLSTR